MARYALEPYSVASSSGVLDATGLEELFSHRDSVWSGADIMAPLVLEDGSIWFFGCDTWLGGANPDGTPSSSTRMARNSVLALAGGKLTAWLGPGRSSALTSATPDTWLWPMSAVADHVGNVKVIAMRVKKSAGTWGFSVDGYDVSVLRRYDMTVLPSRPAPCTPVPVWNGSATRYGRNVYVYGFRREDRRQVVARTSVSGMDSIAWRYWAGPLGWVEDPNAMAPLPVTQRPFRSLWVTPYNGLFYASSHIIDAYSDTHVNVWRSPSLTGPFEPCGVAATLTVPDHWMSYAARVVELPDGLVAMHSVNRQPGTDTAIDIWQYGLHFGPADQLIFAS